MKLTKEKIDELKEKYPGVKLWHEQTDDDDEESASVVVRSPTGVVFRRFLDELTEDDAKRGKAMRKFVDACVVFPHPKEEAEEVKAIFDEHPGLVVTLAGKLRELGGMKRAAEGKEL